MRTATVSGPRSVLGTSHSEQEILALTLTLSCVSGEWQSRILCLLEETGLWWRRMKGRGGSYSWTSKTEESGSDYQTCGFWSCCLHLAACMQWHNLGNRLVVRLPPWRKWRLWGFQCSGCQGLRRYRLQRGLRGYCFYEGTVSTGSSPPSVKVKWLLQSLKFFTPLGTALLYSITSGGLSALRSKRAGELRNFSAMNKVSSPQL